jgi:UDP-N-acetylglucosamine--N-acetylmuramyl-(pentapeptide) pyrophosphoryl-undecaprenol N-acetylglucosamine transferase
MNIQKKLLIAGGGTGGHIFPGLAVAEKWRAEGGEVVFVGTERGKEKEILSKYGFDVKFVAVGPLKGGKFFSKLKTLWRLPKALCQSLKVIREVKPDLILGIGGYASGPTLMAGWLKRMKTAILDQNAQPGLTNRILGKFAKKVFISFGESSPFFPERKVFLTGNPLRSQINFSDYKMPENDFYIFVFGGSQGAKALNEGFLAAINRLPQLWVQIKIWHQARAEEVESIKKFYVERKIEAVVKAFFDNMNELYQKAHLVICRAGAGTVTELAMSGRPSILIPYPYAADDHQKKNAQVLEKKGAAWILEQHELTGEKLATKILELKNNPQELGRAAKAAKELAKPNAAKEIVDELLKM